jgi:pSer/pThr/pTyr-binding forkhead associated (FHA) protein
VFRELVPETGRCLESESEESAFAPEEPAAAEQEPSGIGKLVSKDGAYAFPIKDGVNTIGRRAGDNDIVIPDPYCSGKHAELTAQGGVFTITDLGSTNGTQVNGVRLEPNDPRVLQPADEITLGQIVFTIA